MDDVFNDFQSDIESSVPKAIAQEILNNLFNQKASGQFCDVQFLHGSAILWAHSCVLASYSPFMMRLFNKYAEENVSWSFNKPIQVNISSVSKCNGTSRNNCVSCTCKVLDFIYTGKIKLDPEHLDHVVNLSNNLEIDVLLLICQRYKRDNFTLLDSLSKSSRITAESCENIVDVKAYVDLLNNKISNGTYWPTGSNKQDHRDVSFRKSARISASVNVTNTKNKSIENTSLIHSTDKKVSNQFEEKQSAINSPITEESLKFDKEYTCTACNFKSVNCAKFKQHKMVFHIRNYLCLECNYTSFKMADVINHLIKSSHGGRTCSVCLYEADSKDSLQIHFNEHTRSYPFRCTMCKQRFKYRSDWVRHKYSPYHENNLHNSIEKPNITPIVEVHNSVEKPNITPNVEVHNSIEKPNITPTVEVKSNYLCRICKYEFSSNDLLKKHSHIFHKRKYICLSCDYNTFKIEAIVEHLTETKHEENVCSICLFVADNSDALKQHILDHKNPLPFSCSVCDTRFQTRNEWWRHELAHGSDKPFKCQYCSLSFQTSSYLKTHLLYKHEQKKHTCKVCGYGAPFASKLERHALTHKKKFECKVNNCSFNCSSEVMLKKHKQVHISKPLSCPLCGLKIKFAKNMKRHIRLAHNPKNVMINCPSCGYSNNRIDKMKEHCKNMHANDKSVLEIINKQYKDIKTYQVPETIKKQRRSQIGKEKVSKSLSVANSQNNDVSTEKEVDNMLDASKDSENKFVQNTVSDPLKQTVLLSEATSELNILCENEGKPIPVASVTSTNMVTIGNFREGTGSMTLNETTGVLTLNNINVDSKGAVFLNESTGVLSYINLNVENSLETNNTNEEQDVRSEQIQLNEVTGEIVTVREENALSNKNINTTLEEDFPFDTFGFDFNEDSYDGFDDFDSLFFDTFSPVDPSSSNMEEILKNNTNELFGNCGHIPRLDEMTGELTFDKDSLDHQWSSVNTFTENSMIESVTTEVYESLLNEVTGEFS